MLTEPTLRVPSLLNTKIFTNELITFSIPTPPSSQCTAPETPRNVRVILLRPIQQPPTLGALFAFHPRPCLSPPSSLAKLLPLSPSSATANPFLPTARSQSGAPKVNGKNSGAPDFLCLNNTSTHSSLGFSTNDGNSCNLSSQFLKCFFFQLTLKNIG